MFFSRVIKTDVDTDKVIISYFSNSPNVHIIVINTINHMYNGFSTKQQKLNPKFKINKKFFFLNG